MIAELRRVQVEVNSFDEGSGEFDARAIAYGVVDLYRTIFDPGCCTRSLKGGLPDVRWGHKNGPDGIVGAVVDYRDSPTELDIIGQLMPPGTRRHTRQAWDGLRHRVLDEVSIGFRYKPETTYVDDNGVKHFTQIELDEVSLVMEAAVPGAKVLAVRTPTGSGAVAERLAAAEGRSTPARPTRTIDHTALDAEIDATLRGRRR